MGGDMMGIQREQSPPDPWGKLGRDLIEKCTMTTAPGFEDLMTAAVLRLA